MSAPPDKSKSAPLTLRDIKPDEKVRVLKIKGRSNIRKHLMDMGVTPGSEIKVERFAPLGDPIQISLRGYNLSLRKSEAALITVEKIEHD